MAYPILNIDADLQVVAKTWLHRLKPRRPGLRFHQFLPFL